MAGVDGRAIEVRRGDDRTGIGGEGVLRKVITQGNRKQWRVTRSPRVGENEYIREGERIELPVGCSGDEKLRRVQLL